MLRVRQRCILGGQVYDPHPRPTERGPEVPQELEAECRDYPPDVWEEDGGSVPEFVARQMTKAQLLDLCESHEVRAKRGRRFGSNASEETLVAALTAAGVVIPSEEPLTK